MFQKLQTNPLLNKAKQIDWITFIPMAMFVVYFYFKSVELFWPTESNLFFINALSYLLCAATTLVVVKCCQIGYTRFEICLVVLFVLWDLVLNIYYDFFNGADYVNLLCLTVLSFSVPFLIKNLRMEKIFFVILFVPYILLRAYFAVIGILCYVTWNEIYFTTDGPDIYLKGLFDQLVIIWHPNQTSLVYILVCILCLIGFFLFRAKLARIAFGSLAYLSFIVCVLAKSRSGSYVGIAAISVAIGGFVFYKLGQRFTRKNILIAIGSTVAGFVLVIGLMNVTLNLFDAWQSERPADADRPEAIRIVYVTWDTFSGIWTQDEVELEESIASNTASAVLAINTLDTADAADIVSTADAADNIHAADAASTVMTASATLTEESAEDEEETTTILDAFLDMISLGREMGTIITLNGRLFMWKGALDYLVYHPMALLKGAHTDVDMYIQQIADVTGYYFGHLHSSYAHIIMAYGLPGWFLFFALVGSVALRSVYYLLTTKNFSTFLYACLVLALSLNGIVEKFFTEETSSMIPILLAYSIGMMCARTKDYSFKKLRALMKGADTTQEDVE